MKILVADSEPAVRWIFRKAIPRRYKLFDAGDFAEAKYIIETHRPDIAFVDAHIYGGDVVELVRKDIFFVVVSYNPSEPKVLSALEAGARRVLKKPLDFPSIKKIVEEVESIKEERSFSDEDIIICNSAIIDALKKLNVLVSDRLPVFIWGERSVGRKTLARYVLRHKGIDYVEVDAKDIKLEDVLKKDMTYIVYNFNLMMRSVQEAFFDAVRSFSASRVLIIGEDNVLNIAAKGAIYRDLAVLIAEREVYIPPLRERRDEIPLFVDLAVKRWMKKRGVNREVNFTEKAIRALTIYKWPGNIGELFDVVYRTLEITSGDIDFKDLPAEIVIASEDLTFVPYMRKDVKNMIKYGREGIYDKVIKTAEKVLLEEALIATGGNKIGAARILGIHRNTMRNKLKMWGG